MRQPDSITRRGFIVGAAGVAATAAISLEGCSDVSAQQKITEGVKAQFPHAQVEYLNVEPMQVLPHSDMNMLDSLDYLSETHRFSLPLGSLLYQSSDTKALVVAPGASSNALIRLGFVDFETGTLAPILDQALGVSEDYVIYDARASSTALAWVECNMVQGLWRVYAVLHSDGIGSEETKLPYLLDEGAGSYMPPQLAVHGTKVYWTVMPDPAGPASTSDSYLMAAELKGQKQGDKLESKIVYTSHGRMITTPLVSGDVLTLVPRVDTDLVYYQLTTIDVKTDAVQNIAILPPSVRVSDAVWLTDGFSFGIEGNYDYAKGLSLFGTYLQLGDGKYLYINKAPTSATMRMKSLTYVKSTKNVLGLDPKQGNVVVVDTPQDCIDYGDILAGVGSQNRLVLYTTVTPRIGQLRGECRVRVFDPY